MAFKINIGTNDGKTFHLETEGESLVGKKLRESVKGEEVSPDLGGYEFEISGASDNAGFPSLENTEGPGLKRELLSYGKAMHIHPKKEGKKKRSNTRPKGLRLRKTVRGNTISSDITQINLKILKEGGKKLSEIFPDQGQGKVKENRAFKRKQKAEAPAEPVEEKVGGAEGKGAEEAKEEKPVEKQEAEEKKE